MTTVTADQLQVCRDYATARCQARKVACRYQRDEAVRLLDEARRIFRRADRETRRALHPVIAALNDRQDITDPGMALIAAEIRLEAPAPNYSTGWRLEGRA